MPLALTPILTRIRPTWFQRWWAKMTLKAGGKMAYERRADILCLNCDSTEIRIRGFVNKKEVKCEEGFEGATQMSWEMIDAFCESCGQDMRNEINHQDLHQRYP
jgi:Zn finger protein HypA/HybF involved in hydrogenase expression